MPSPLNGLMAPPASPTTNHVGPTRGPTDRPIGRRPPNGPPDRPICSRPPTGTLHAVSGRMSHDLGAQSTKASINLVVLTAFHWLNVESRPMPTFTRPSPTGKIHP